MISYNAVSLSINLSHVSHCLVKSCHVFFLLYANAPTKKSRLSVPGRPSMLSCFRLSTSQRPQVGSSLLLDCYHHKNHQMKILFSLPFLLSVPDTCLTQQPFSNREAALSVQQCFANFPPLVVITERSSSILIINRCVFHTAAPKKVRQYNVVMITSVCL